MLFITGATGMLGGYLIEQLDALDMKYIAPNREQFDLSSSDSMRACFKDKKVSCVVHLAAETDVDLCERDPARAYQKNVLATEELAKFARAQGVPMIYISTSAVFGGIAKLKYCELDVPMPISMYGASKYFGEERVRALCPDHLIIRCSFMIGGGPTRDKKFISKILPMLKEGKPVSMVQDKIGSLTYAKDVASLIIKAYQEKIFGLIHYASEDGCSRFDVAAYIAKKIGSTSQLTRVDSASFPLSAPRPMSEVLYSVSPFKPHAKPCTEIIDDYLVEWR